MILRVRLEAIKKNFKNAKQILERLNLSKKYVSFLKKRTKLSDKERLKLNFDG